MSAASVSIFLCTLNTSKIATTKPHIGLLSAFRFWNIRAVYHQVRLIKYVYHQRRQFLSPNRHFRFYSKWTQSTCMFAALLSNCKHVYVLRIKTLFPSLKSTLSVFFKVCQLPSMDPCFFLSRCGMKVSKMPILALYVSFCCIQITNPSSWCLLDFFLAAA